MTATSVIICGMPCSGNRLLQRLIVRSGAAACNILHFGSAVPRFIARARFRGERILAVMPLRDRELHWKACCRSPDEATPPPAVRRDPAATVTLTAPRGRFQDANAMHAAHFWPALRALAEAGVPVLPVTYELLVSDPEVQGHALVDWLGLEWDGWGEVVYDANAKYRVAVQES